MEKQEKRNTKPPKRVYTSVNQYELLCLESSQESQEPDEKRILLAFEALADLVPKLGVYSPIFKKLQTDLHAAVYSDELTAQEQTIHKVPYFTLVQKVYDERNDRVETLDEQLDTVKRRLFEKHKQLEEGQQKNADSEDFIKELQDNMTALERTIIEKDDEIETLKKELEIEKENSEQKEQDLQREIEVLNDYLMETKEDVESLSKYKKGYDNLCSAFQDTGESFEETPKPKRPVLYEKRANLINSVQAGQKLENQIMTVLNTAVEDFEKFLENHRQELEQFNPRENMTETELEVADLDLDQADQQLESEQVRFQDSVSEVTHELNLLKRHSDMLMEQLEDMEYKESSLGQRSRNGEPLGMTKSDSILSAGLEGDDEEEMDDPFIAQERVFCKYAAMIYVSSNDGKSYEELKESKFCASCCEKTSICPHKLPQGEKIIVLPQSCSHIKIARPKVRINKELKKDVLNVRSPENTFDSLVLSHPTLEDYALETPATDGQSVAESEENILNYTAQILFDDFRDRTRIERSVPRQISLERTISLTEQLWAHILWQDDNLDSKKLQMSILDCVYDFMLERYLTKEVSDFCAFDYLYAVTEYSGENRSIQLLFHVLTANLDGACFRYILLMCDFIGLVDWQEVEDFRGFAAIVFPFLSEDDLESLQMSYTSFSENKISPLLVAHFFIHIILKNREPYFHESEHRLLPFQTEENIKPILTKAEFEEAVDAIVPMANERLVDRLFNQCEAHCPNMDLTKGTSIRGLAQVISYLSLLQATTVIRNTVATKVVELREGQTNSDSKVAHQTQLVESDEDLLTWSGAKQLASIIARRSKHRQERLDAPW